MNRTIIMAAHVAEWQHHPFAWGKHDCFLFTAAGLVMLGAPDVAKGFRGYRTEKGATKKLADHGYSCVSEIFAARFEAVDRLMVGDAALVELGGVRAMGLVTGRGIHAITETRGLRLISHDLAQAGYRV